MCKTIRMYLTKSECSITYFSFKQILDFIRQSKGWQYVERVSKDSAENIMMNVSEEELYNLPTAEYVNRRGGFVFKQHTVYHVAIHACAELRSKEVIFCLCITIFHYIFWLLHVGHAQST